MYDEALIPGPLQKQQTPHNIRVNVKVTFITYYFKISYKRL